MLHGPAYDSGPDHSRHEWVPEEQEILVDEDVWIRWPCGWVEITGSQTSERLDETFYEEGASCGAMKVARYEVTVDHPDIDIVMWDGELTMQQEDVLIQAYEWLEDNDVAYYTGMIEPHSPQDEIVIDPDEQVWTVTLELAEERVENEGDFY